MKKPVYESPRAEIIAIETQGVLCASGMKNSSTESITIEGFEFP
jgi:hypothetical protein